MIQYDTMICTSNQSLHIGFCGWQSFINQVAARATAGRALGIFDNTEVKSSESTPSFFVDLNPEPSKSLSNAVGPTPLMTHQSILTTLW